MRATSIALTFGRQRWWWQTFAAMSLVILCTTGQLHADAAPVMPGSEGQRAFDDLTKLYKEERYPDLGPAFKDLQAEDADTRAQAGKYILALCQQSLDDEQSGRSTYSRLPPGFGEAPDNLTREFRKDLRAATGAKRSARRSNSGTSCLIGERLVGRDTRTRCGSFMQGTWPRGG